MRHLVCFIKSKTKTVSKISRSILAFSILLGTFFVPNREVEAGLLSSFSSIFTGDQAYAETSSDTIKIPQIGDNSQTIALLQANVSSLSVLKGKDSSIDDNSTDNIVSGTSLLSAVGPMGVSDGKNTSDSSFDFDQISVYVVRKGDSISQIADMFDVSTNTILWANDMKKGDKLVEGDTLMILPISGVKHIVLKGQTLKGIAKKYNVDVIDIASFNGLASNAQLALGDELIIPDAEMINTEAPKPKTNPINTVKTTLKTLVGYFINPVPGYKRVSQGLHGKNGVDLAAPTGTKIVAAASGTVLLARNGYNGGYGNMVIIKHPNGTQTLYAHQSKIATKTGAKVSQGETIGYVGSTGHSTGPHLHYEIHGARNNALDL